MHVSKVHNAMKVKVRLHKTTEIQKNVKKLKQFYGTCGIKGVYIS